MTYDQIEEKIRKWAEDQAAPGLFAPFDPEATAAALRGIAELYAWMAEETAVRKGRSYPTAPAAQVHG